MQQQEEVAPGQRGDQVGQLGIEVRVLGQQEQRLVDPGQPAVRDDHAQITELAPDVVQHRRPAQLQLRVDPGGPGLVEHHRDAEVGGLAVDGERQLAVVRGPVLVHRVELHPGQAKAGDCALQLGGRGGRAAESRIDRCESDEMIGIRPDDRGDVVIALLRIRRAPDPEQPAGVDRSDQSAVEVLRRYRQDNDLVEARMITA